MLGGRRLWRRQDLELWADWGFPDRQEFIARIRQTLDDLAAKGEAPALLTSPTIRPFVRSIIERFRPTTTVLSQSEIHPHAKIRTLAQV